LSWSSDSGAGAVTRVASANGTRTNSPWAPSFIVPSAFAPPHQTTFSQEVKMPLRQFSHVPHEPANGAMTKSPGVRPVTASPTSVTVPTNSWPMCFPTGTPFTPRYGHRSEPHTHAAATFTMASVGWTRTGSGTSSARKSFRPWTMVASMSLLRGSGCWIHCLVQGGVTRMVRHLRRARG